MPAEFPITEIYTAAFHTADSRTAADFPAARRRAITPARSAASIMEASRMRFPPAEVGVSAEGESTAVEGSMVVEAPTVAEVDIDEHEASSADKSIEGEGHDA